MASFYQSAAPLTNNDKIVRPLADFPKDIWGDRFDSFILDKQVHDSYAKEIEMFKEQVKSMLLNTESDTIQEKLNLIDSVERLGIWYHFQEEIEQQLETIFNLYSNFEEYPKSYDLYTSALHFRLLRQHGFNVSVGIFYQFVDHNGKFKESLISDIKGLLSLYEASQVRTHGDTILEEANAFATTHLISGAAVQTSSLISKQVKYALELALHKCIPRLTARHYISIFQEDESNSKLILRLAKLNYNLLQMMHKQELVEIIRWEKDLDIVSKLPHSRARIVESYFFAVGMFIEPQYSLARKIVAKTTILLTAVDDTYDAYGTIEELKSYTNAIERWGANEIDGLPSYMQTSYSALLKYCNELDKEFSKLGRSYALNHYKEAWKQYAKTSCTESGWFSTGELPTFPDYLNNGLITGVGYLCMATTLLAMESATEDVFNWLSKIPKISVACAKICRLKNDVGSYQAEKKWRATGIECYMKNYNASEQEAMKKFEEIVEDAWKDVNEEILMPTTTPREILERFLNLVRAAYVFYKNREDGFSNPHKIVEAYITALFVDPIVVV